MKPIWYAVTGLAAGAAIVGASWFFTGNDNTTLASVGGQKITHKQFVNELETAAGNQIMQRMINEKVVVQGAQKLNITVSDDELNKELDSFKQQFPPDQFQSLLKQNNMTEADVKEKIKVDLLMKKLAVKDVKLTDDDLKKEYEAHKQDYATPEQVKARHILVDNENDAKDIKARLDKGEDFAKLAKEKSKDPGSAANGGDLPLFGKGEMVPEFEKAAFSMKPGETSGPVKTEHGYHIIQVQEHHEAKTPSFEEVKSKVEEKLKQEKATPQDQLLKDLQKQVDVKINSDKYKDVLNQPTTGSAPQ